MGVKCVLDERPMSAGRSWSWGWGTSHEPKIPAPRTCHKGELDQSRAAPSRRFHLPTRSLKVFALHHTSSTHFTFLQKAIALVTRRANA